MKKLVVFVLSFIAYVNVAFAGGLLTNTNQHASFHRMLARGASISIDGVYSNPAGLGFMKDGIYLSLNMQSVYQTRVIDANFARYGADNFITRYKGTASAPVVPSFQAVYKKGDWAVSGSFAISGGGGKASFDTGLPLFDAKIMAGIFQKSEGKVTPEMYTINSAMDGRQYIYGLQLGLSYLINEYFSVFGGARMNYVTSGYEGFLDATLKANASNLMKVRLDCSQSGWGLTPIVGVDFKYGKWNLAAKYEFMANLNIENKTKENTHGNEGEVLYDYRDGVNTPNDIPAMLMAAVGYEFTPKLRATVEYHQFFDKDAGMANIQDTAIPKQKALKGNTHEVLAGIEWDMNQYLTISGGYQKTNYGLSDDFQSDLSFSLNSYSVGLGAAIHFSPRVTMNVGYFWTTYSDYTKKSDNYKGTHLTGTDVYSRTNKVFGAGVDFKF